MLEEKRLTRFRREARQRPADRVVPLGLPVRSRQRRGLERGGIVHEPASPPSGARASRAAPVHQNAIQPRTEALGIVAARQRAIGTDEGVLQPLFRVFPSSEHVQRVAAQAIAIPRDEIGVSTGVAGLHTAHQSGVARPHVTYTHARPPGVTSLSRSGSCDAALHRRGIYHKGDLQVRCQRSWSMSRRATLAGFLAVALSLAGCYQDDTTVTAPPRLRPRITVRLTDAPFPYDSLHGVTIYVVRIEASTAQDSSGGDLWAVITEPRKSFDLLALQQGTTALLGEGEMPAGRYHRIRMTIDTSLSSITWNDAAQTPAHVNWYGQSSIYASVEYPVDVPTEGADIVLDFDVGRSFLYNFSSNNNAFDFNPILRAINSAAVGAIAGTVTQDSGGTTRPVPNAQVDVYTDSVGYNLEATGRSDQAGHYKVGFLPPGSYLVKIEEPFIPSLEPVATPNVQVTAGGTATVSVTLPQAGAGHAYIHISGPTQVGVGGGINLFAAVGDASGNPIQNPSITWTSSDPTVAAIQGGNDTVTSAGVSVRGVQAGVATIHATSSGLTDSLVVHVVALGSLATVTIEPASATITVGDSGVYLQAVFRDSAGQSLGGGASWFSSDTTVVFVYPCGSCNGHQELDTAPGMATVFATSQGKTGQATITVGPSAPAATVTVVPGSASLTGGDNATFTAQLRDAAGNILSNRSVSWSSTDASIVEITSVNGPSATILARAAGLASLRATSEGKTGEASISVAAPAPVATVTVVPNTADLAVGDSGVTFRADLRDAAGNLLTNRSVSWSASDNSIISVR